MVLKLAVSRSRPPAPYGANLFIIYRPKCFLKSVCVFCVCVFCTKLQAGSTVPACDSETTEGSRTAVE